MLGIVSSRHDTEIARILT